MNHNTPEWLNHQFAESISVMDILAINIQNNIATFTLGVAATGDVFTTSAVMFNSSGMVSFPLPPGSYSNGTFSASSTSTQAAQALCVVRNDKYLILSILDTRNASLAPTVNQGETSFYAPNGGSSMHLQEKVIDVAADNTVDISTNTANITANSINLGNNPSQYIVINPDSLISFLDSLITAIQNATYVNASGTATTLVFTPPSTSTLNITSQTTKST